MEKIIPLFQFTKYSMYSIFLVSMYDETEYFSEYAKSETM